MANGIKFTQVGTDISAASDHEIHFSSEWPNLKIMLRGRLTKNVALGTTVPIYRHNLGFVPAFLPFEFDTASQSYQIFRSTFHVDKEYIYWVSPGIGGSGGFIDVTVGIDLFAVDITKNYEAPIDNSRQESYGGSDQSYGIRIAIQGSTLLSPDLQDRVLDTDTRAPLLHAVSTGVGTLPGPGASKNYAYTHTLPYNPIFMAYVEDTPGKYYLINNYAGLTTSGNTITVIGLATGTKASIVVLKDPFNASENTLVINV